MLNKKFVKFLILSENWVVDLNSEKGLFSDGSNFQYITFSADGEKSENGF